MNGPETSRLLAMLKTEFPRETVDENRVKIWTATLATIRAPDAATAVAHHLADPDRGRFFPHPADILKIVGELTGPAPALRSGDREAQRFVFNRWDDETSTYQRIVDPVPYNHLEPGSYEAAIVKAFTVPFLEPKRQPPARMATR